MAGNFPIVATVPSNFGHPGNLAFEVAKDHQEIPSFAFACNWPERYSYITAKIKWLVLTHIRSPQLQLQYTRECSVTRVQCNKITFLKSQARSSFLGAWDRNGLVQICVANGLSFLEYNIVKEFELQKKQTPEGP